MKKHQQFFDDMAKFVGLFVIAVIVAGLAIGLVYGLLGYLSDNGRRLLATGLIFAVLGAFVLGLQIGKAHVKGVERGLDLKLGAKERAQAARAIVAQPSTAQRFDDLLPRVGSAAIVQRRDEDTTPIEM
jgi:hypothetical protein